MHKKYPKKLHKRDAQVSKNPRDCSVAWGSVAVEVTEKRFGRRSSGAYACGRSQEQHRQWWRTPQANGVATRCKRDAGVGRDEGHGLVRVVVGLSDWTFVCRDGWGGGAGLKAVDVSYMFAFAGCGPTGRKSVDV